MALVCVACSTTNLHAQYPSADTLHATGKPMRGKPLRLAMDVNWTLGISAPEFFKDYQYYLGGQASGFDIPPGVAFTMSSYQFGNVSFGIGVGYYKAAMRESYTYSPTSRPEPIGPEQSVTQTMLFTIIPTMFTLDYHPLLRQFTGYIGCGVGVGAVHAFWEEAVSPSGKPGARVGGVRYDDWQATPLINMHAGISLGFDQLISQRSRPGLFFEVAYQWIPATGPFFKEVEKSITKPLPQLRKNYTIQTGGFVLRIGFEVMLNGG